MFSFSLEVNTLALEVQSNKDLVDQAKANQKIVIAEGVEDEDTIRLLNKWDIRFMQGFHFSEPVSVEDAEKMIRKSPWDMFSFNHLIK